MLFQGEGDVLLELVGGGAEDSPDLVARQVRHVWSWTRQKSGVANVPAVFLSPGCRSHPSSYVYLDPVQPCVETGMHCRCNPSLWHFAVVQNSFPPDQC